MTSEHGHGFGIIKHILGADHYLSTVSNSGVGIAFYLTMLMAVDAQQVGVVHLEKFILLASVVSCVSSVWLIYVLVFVMFDFCVVCFATHVVNFSILYISLRRRRTEKPAKRPKTS